MEATFAIGDAQMVDSRFVASDVELDGCVQPLSGVGVKGKGHPLDSLS